MINEVDFEPRSMEKTMTGLTLMTIGLFLEWIPDIDYVGVLLMIIGTIYMIMGRHGFGDKHSRYVKIAVAIYIIMSIIIFISILTFVFSTLLSISMTTNGGANIPVTSFNEFILVIMAMGAILSLSYLILIWAISGSFGRKILMIGYAAQIIISGVILGIMTPEIDSSLNDLNNFTSREASLLSEIGRYSFLGAIPLLIYAYAYFLARQRVKAWVEKQNYENL